MKIRAAILDQSGLPAPFAQSLPLRIETLDLAPPGPGEVLVKMCAAGICHSDLSVLTGDRPRPLPMVLGHEASARVVETGAGVGDLRAGDLVVLVFVPSCGRCLPCSEGRPALCEPAAAANLRGTLLSGARRLSREKADRNVCPTINHLLGVSAFADHAVVSRQSCIKIDLDIDPVEAALFGCAVLTGVGAVANTAGVRPGATVAVVGLGGVGLCAVLGALAAGARDVVAVDLHAGKLQAALALGATAAVNARDANAVEQVRDLTRGGAEFVFEMAGSVQALETSYRITRRGGTTVSAGLPHPQAQFGLAPLSLVAEERTLKGSFCGSCVPLRDIPRYMGLYQAGRLPVNKLLGERLGLEGINSAFDRMARGEGLRDVVVFE